LLDITPKRMAEKLASSKRLENGMTKVSFSSRANSVMIKDQKTQQQNRKTKIELIENIIELKKDQIHMIEKTENKIFDYAIDVLKKLKLQNSQAAKNNL